MVVAEWGWVGQSVAHSAPELSQLVAVAFELSIQIGWRLVSIAAVISSSHCLEIGLPQAMPFPASTQRVSQPLRFVGHVPVNVGTGNLGLDQNQIDSKRFPKHTLRNFQRIIAKCFEEGISAKAATWFCMVFLLPSTSLRVQRRNRRQPRSKQEHLVTHGLMSCSK